MKVSGKLKKVSHALVNALHRLPVVLLVVSVVMILVSIVCITYQVTSCPERNCAKVWGQGSTVKYCHVSVFAKGARPGGESTPASYIDSGVSLVRQDLPNIHKSLQGIIAEGNWTDSYSSFTKSEVAALRTPGDASEVEIYAVGGNFKAFHPFECISGGFLPLTPVDQYHIVLNDTLAWKMYGSSDVTGERLKLWGKDYTVIGVVKDQDDDLPRAYVYFSCLEELCAGLDNPVVPSILCYEIMLPENIPGEAILEVRNTLPSQELYVENITDRFSLSSVWDHMMPPGKNDDIVRGYEMPYWEISSEKVVKNVFAWGVVMAFGFALGVGMGGVVVMEKMRIVYGKMLLEFIQEKEV